MLISDAFRILSEANLKIASLGSDYVDQAGSPKQPKTLLQLTRVRQLYNIINKFVFINDAGTAIAGTFGQNDDAINRLLLQLKKCAKITSFPVIPNPIQTFITESCCGSSLPGSGSEGDILVFQSGIWNNFPKGSDGYSLVSTPTGIAWSSTIGNGIPSGGAASQYLKKNSNASYDVIWDYIETTDINGVTASAAEINVLDGVTGVGPTQINFLAGVTSNIQTQLNNKLSATLADGSFWVGNVSNVATPVIPTGDVVFSNAGVFSISAGAIINTDVNAAAAIARTKLASGNAYRVLINDVSGVMADASLITPDRVLISDANGIPTHSLKTTTQLSYLDATSSIQNQLNSKLSVVLDTVTQGDLLQYNGTQWVNFHLGTVGQVLTSNGTSAVWGASTANGLPSGGTTNQILRKASGTDYDVEWHSLVMADITDVSTTAAELNLLSGLTATAAELNFTTGGTSNFQTQINLKLSTSLTYNSLFIGNVSNTASMLGPGAENQVLQIIAGSPTWQTFTPGTGSVTSIDVDGGTTGMTFTGGPITTTGTITMSGTLDANNGGTGFAAYAVGDILYADTTSTLAKRVAGTNGYVLTMSGGLPVWAAAASAVFGSDIPVVLSGGKSLGRFTNGQTIPSSGLTPEQVVVLLATEYIPPAFTSFAISGQAQTVEVGTTLTTPATFTWAITVNSGVVATLDIKDVTGATTLLANTSNDGTQSGIALGAILLNSNGASRSYEGTLHDTGTSPSDIDSSLFTVTSRFYRFFGPTATSPTNSATVRALPSSAFQLTAPTFILNTGTTITKFVVALPPGITIVSVYDIDALGANITSSYVLTGTINVTDAGGTSRSYNIYEMNIGAAYASNHQHSITTT